MSFLHKNKKKALTHPSAKTRNASKPECLPTFQKEIRSLAKDFNKKQSMFNQAQLEFFTKFDFNQKIVFKLAEAIKKKQTPDAEITTFLPIIKTKLQKIYGSQQFTWRQM